MKRLLVSALALMFLVPAAWAADKSWPDELANVQRMVRAQLGDIDYDRVNVNQRGEFIEVSIDLKKMPRQLRTLAREKTVDEVFLAALALELFKPSLEFDIVSFDILPIADIIDYYFGFVAFNFGKTIKLPVEIAVRSGSGQEFSYTKNKYKLKKNKIYLIFVERGVSGGGLHALDASVGPWEQTGYFCVDCT